MKKTNGMLKQLKYLALWGIFMLMFSLSAWAQPVYKGQLVADGEWHTVDYGGKNAMDYTLPATTTYKFLQIEVEGADGGKRYNDDLNILYARGGEGATVRATYELNNSQTNVPAGELRTGTGDTLRMVIGQHGENRKTTLITAAGGGGGSAVLYKRQDLGNWELLAVAGGGGGAAASSVEKRDGKPGVATTNGGDGGGDNGGNGGTEGGPGGFNKEVFFEGGYPGGGKAWSDATYAIAEDHDFNSQDIYFGRPGLTEGNSGGTGYNGQFGGWGFGGGGNGTTGGGGGGGYSGGGAGGYLHGGGGGGSYINAYAIPVTVQKTENGTTSSPDHGFVKYRFTNEAPVYKTIRGTGQVAFGQLMQNGNYHLYWQQSDGNLVLYDKTSGSKAIWACGAKGTDAKLYFQGDGNLVIYVNGSAKWSTQTADAQQDGNGGRYLVLKSDGQLAILNADGETIWQAN